MNKGANWKSKATLLEVVNICGSKGATISSIMDSLSIPKGSTSGFTKFIVDSFGVNLSITNDGPRNSKVYHLDNSAKDHILSTSKEKKKKSSVSNTAKSGDDTSDRKLVPITNEKKKEVMFDLIEVIYNSKDHRIRRCDIFSRLNKKVSNSYIGSLLDELMKDYSEAIIRSIDDPDEVIIKDYQSLIHIIRPDLEYLRLVVSASRDVEISSKVFPALCNANIKKSEKLSDNDIYSITVGNNVNVSKALMRMRIKGVRILFPVGLEEKVDKAIEDAIEEHYKVLR